MTQSEIKLLAKAYAFILGPAWGKDKETTGAVDLAEDPAPVVSRGAEHHEQRVSIISGGKNLNEHQ